jgi:hypothetical protein
MSYLDSTRRAGRLLALSAALLLAGVAHAVPEAQFQDAFAQFSQAQGGEDAAIERAAKTFASLSHGEPGSPVLLAYAGASTAMLAGTTFFPWKKMGYAEDGMAMLDKALAQLTPAQEAMSYGGLPAVLNVRFVAANTFLAVPKFMNRAAQGNKLLSEVLTSPLLTKAPLGFQGAVWLRAAKLAEVEHRADDARRYLNLVIDGKAPQAEAARAQITALAP